MIGSLETSLSSLNTHGLLAQAQQVLVGQSPIQGQFPLTRDAVIEVRPTPSLTQNADALKSQEEALNLLDSVFSAANAVLQQVSPLYASRQALGETPATEVAAQAELIDHRIRDLLQNATFEGAKLFDPASVNSASLEGILKEPPQASRISLFSPEVRARLSDAFERAFDLYA